MTRSDDVLRLLVDVRLPLDDDDIASRLGINRHYVNAVCRGLADRGLVKRTEGPAGKLVTAATEAATASTPAGRPSVTPKSRGYRSRSRRSGRARSNVDQLIATFDESLSTFEASNAFPGPSLHFHQRAIDVRRSHGAAAAALADTHLLELIYAVLPSWGMHRMGRQAAKVGDFDHFCESIRGQTEQIAALWNKDIRLVSEADVEVSTEEVWMIISALRVSTSRSKLVAGSKTLHHLLPDLVPPIDRQYTFKFFTGQTQVSYGEQTAFAEWFPLLCEIARSCDEEIEAALERGGFMATSASKVIDNAIMGFRQMQQS